jgi:hypothetical protein
MKYLLPASSLETRGEEQNIYENIINIPHKNLFRYQKPIWQRLLI